MSDKQMNICLKPGVESGAYSNLAIITHSHSEFIIDFASSLPGMPSAVIGNRIIMAPEHAKRLLLALQENIQKYESSNGKIELESPVRVPISFNGSGKSS